MVLLFAFFFMAIVPPFGASITLKGTNPSSLTMGIRNSFSKFTNLFKRRERSDAVLKSGIAKFYDESSGIWLDVWGEHMHHGYYPTPDYSDHLQAQVDMIDRAVDWAYGEDLKSANPKTVVDVGCGVGGSSRHILKRFSMQSGNGISLSPYQIQRATTFTKESNLGDKLTYSVADAMEMPFSDGSYDMTWSMESGEHMPDKAAFMKELVRVTAPGGRVIVVTWCHRELRPNEEDLASKELRLLDKINDAYYLPKWVPGSLYVDLAHTLGLEDVRFADWSDFIAPFWPAVFRSALKPKNFFRMMRTGITTIKGAIATLWMLRGFKTGLVKFVLITGRKPNNDVAAGSAAQSSSTGPVN